MKIIDIYSRLDSFCPTHLSCDWDNDGIMCLPDRNASTDKVLLTLDITNGAVEYAKEIGAGLIISHHPLVFSPLRRLSQSDLVGGKLLKLAKNNIAAMSFHTRLDAAIGGVNDALAKCLGVLDTSPFGEDGEMIGRVGDVDECPLSEFAQKVKRSLNAPCVSVAGAGKSVHRVAVLGGAGKDFVNSAIAVGADTFVTGEMGYNALVDARDAGLNVILAGHYYTERPVLDTLAHIISELDPTLKIEFYECDPEQFY